MSDHETRDTGAHPDEALAAFVDGTATDDERELVQAHLASCEACRDELEVARAARSALQGLPDLESPWAEPLMVTGRTGGTGGDGRSNVVRLADRRTRRARIAAGAGIAAAAAVVAILLLGPGFGGKAVGPAAVSSPNAAAAQALDKSGVDSLVKRLAGQSTLALAPTRTGAETRSPAEFGATAKDVGCARVAGGVAETAAAISTRLTTFETTPARITFFRIVGASGSQYVEAVVVRRADCRLLYEVRAPVTASP